MIAIPITGERFVPGVSPSNVSADHIRRYSHILSMVSGKRVLDVACGVGYGSALLARRAQLVVGVDRDPGAVTVAKRALHRRGFVLQADAHSLPFATHTFDCVVSFETIEHLKNPAAFLTEVRRVLRPEGIVWISTPVRKNTVLDRFHRHEFSANELRRLVARYFLIERVEGQRLMFAPLFYCFSWLVGTRIHHTWLYKHLYRRLYGKDEIRDASTSSPMIIPNFLVITARRE